MYLYLDSVANCATLVDADVTGRAASVGLTPGSYSIRIDKGGITKPGGPGTLEMVVHLWLLGGRHLDRSTSVATHSRFRSLCGPSDVWLIDVCRQTTLYAFWFEAAQPYPVGAVTLVIQSGTATTSLDVKAPDHCVPFPVAEVGQKAATLPLAPGTYVFSIDHGEFGFFTELKDAEPMILLWFEGGKLVDRAAGLEIPRMVRVLNGYGAAHVIDVVEPSVVRAFGFDSYAADNSGAMEIRIDQVNVSQKKYKALLIDGRSEHPTWAALSTMLHAYLEQTGLFDIDHLRVQQDHVLPAFITKTNQMQTTTNMKDWPDGELGIDFSPYQVVIMNYSSLALWPPQVRNAFEVYVGSGGGFVSVHSSDNAFPTWLEYNKMIALGGWYNRKSQDGFYVFYDDHGQLYKEKHPDWSDGQHPPASDFLITARNPKHPVMQGLPPQWMHAHDELYSSLKGPADNLDVLATGYSDPAKPDGTGRNEPLLMAIQYGKGRVFHTTLGHTNEIDGVQAAECVGFITTFQRGAEWAASGSVTQLVPNDFPTSNTTRSRKFNF
jgi:hypothetical protein